MSNVVLVSNSSIAFTTRLLKPNGLYYQAPMEAFWCKYGLILPTEINSLNLLDHFDNCWAHDMNQEGGALGMLLSPNGGLYDYYWGTEYPVLQRRRFAYGEGAQFARCNAVRLEEAATMALALKPDLREAVELISQVNHKFKGDMHYYEIPDLLAQMKTRNITLPPPAMAKPVVKDW